MGRTSRFCLFFQVDDSGRTELSQQRPRPEVSLESVSDYLVVHLSDLRQMFRLDEVADKRRGVKSKHLADYVS